MLTAVHHTRATVGSLIMSIIETETARIHTFSVGAMDNNVYIVSCRATNEAVIVDAATDADRILREVSDCRPIAILTTHGHLDHIGAARQVADNLAIPFRLNKADEQIAKLAIDEDLVPGTVRVGNLDIQAIHTPGHTPGSMCFFLDDVLLTGDTLFPGGPGATRFPYSSFEAIMNSLRTDLFLRQDKTVVLPGHGDPTTIGTERPHLDEWQARGW